MKREIKFRGLSISNIWCIGHYYIDPVFEDEKVEWQPMILKYDEFGNEDACIIKKDTLGQFTGLIDKDGSEIYEGDILEYEKDKLMIVGWSEKFASFVLDRKGWAFCHWFGESCNPENCRIVGNIYQDEKLLK